jgi:hypothetical protein
MKLIEHQELGSNQSSITFNSIPQAFTDLVLVISARTNRAEDFGDFLQVRPNNISTGGSGRRLYGTGSTGVSNTTSFVPGGIGSTTNQTANTFGNVTLYIPNYTSSVAKSFSMDGVSENNSSTAIQAITAGLWTGTDPITSLVILPEVGTLIMQFSSATLYGITRGSDGIVTVS